MSVAPLQLSGGGEDAPQSKLKVRPYRLRRYDFPPDYAYKCGLLTLHLRSCLNPFSCIPSRSSIRTVSFVDIYRLYRVHLDDLLRSFPDVAERVHAFALKQRWREIFSLLVKVFYIFYGSRMTEYFTNI